LREGGVFLLLNCRHQNDTQRNIENRAACPVYIPALARSAIWAALSQFGEGLATRSMTMNSRGTLIGSSFRPSCARATESGGALGWLSGPSHPGRRGMPVSSIVRNAPGVLSSGPKSHAKLNGPVTLVRLITRTSSAKAAMPAIELRFGW